MVHTTEILPLADVQETTRKECLVDTLSQGAGIATAATHVAESSSMPRIQVSSGG